MRVLVPVLILFVVSLSWAQAPGIGDVRPLNTAITQACLDDFVVNSKDRKHTQGLPGTYFKSLLPQPGETCNEESSQKKVHYELLLVAESHEGPQPKISDPAEERYTMQYAVQNLLPAFDPKAPLTNWNPDDVRKFAQDSLDKWNQETKKGMFFVLPATLDPSLSVDRNFLVEGLVRAMASANLTETELTKQVGKFIRDTYATEDERFAFINVLSSRLYINYNNARNPFNNNQSTNPAGHELPFGDISLRDLMRGAASFDEFNGGICNDITESMMGIAMQVFPDKDVLAVNQGTHFAMAVVDKKGTRIINGASSRMMQNTLGIIPEQLTSNLRISKYSDGRLKEIAIVDTQMGQLMERAFETGRPTLNISPDVNVLLAHFKRVSEKSNGVSNIISSSVGNSQVEGGKVIVIVAKYEHDSPHWNNYAGAGISQRDATANSDQVMHAHLRLGAERKSIIHFASSKLEFNLDGGAKFEGSVPIGGISFDGSDNIDYSLGLYTHQRLSVATTNQAIGTTHISGTVEVSQTAGPSNMGNLSGAMSSLSAYPSLWNMKRIEAALDNMSFHLNQVNGQLNVDKLVGSNVSSNTTVNYQGSNIGQSVGILSGLRIKYPEGAQILVFTGYQNSHLPGYQTKNSLLVAPQGVTGGVRIQNSKGTEINASVRGISSGRKPTLDLGIKMPITRVP